MSNLPQISEAEFEVMKIVWKYAPISTNEITEKLTQISSWSPKTIQTLIKRLVSKKALTYEKQSRVFVYTPLVKEDEYIRQESNSFFTGNVQQLTADEIEQGFKNMPTFESSKESQNLATWLVDLGIEPSRRQSREDIQNGAISINGEKVTDLEFEWTKEQSFEERFVIVRRGKKKYFLVVLK